MGETPNERTRFARVRLRGEKGGRDSTVVTIGRVSYNADHEPELEVVEHPAWQGAHCQTQEVLLTRLLTETFPCTRIVIDAMGLGAVPAAYLQRALGEARVEAFLFTLPSKSRLGYNLIAMAGTGRLKIYEPLDEEQQRHRGRLLREMETARYELRGMELLSFAVPIKEGHDDYLMSLGLAAWAAAGAPPPPESTIIPPADGPQPQQWDRVW